MEMLVFLWSFCQFYGQMVYFMAIRYILWTFGIFFPVLVCWTKRNLANVPASISLYPQGFPAGWASRVFQRCFWPGANVMNQFRPKWTDSKWNGQKISLPTYKGLFSRTVIFVSLRVARHRATRLELILTMFCARQSDTFSCKYTLNIGLSLP
jgi:hypothetical protein